MTDQPMAVTADVQEAPSFEEWAIVEFMGHRRYAGKLSEATLAGQGFLRLDVYVEAAELPIVTQFYSPGSVYCITPVAEDVARKVAANSQPQPVSRYELMERSTPRDPADEPF